MSDHSSSMSDHSSSADLKFPGGNARDPLTFEFPFPVTGPRDSRSPSRR